MKQYLKLKLSQKLSPQQIQLMKLIQLPTLDFEQKIQREIEENPALEQGQNSDDDNQQENQDDFSDSESSDQSSPAESSKSDNEIQIVDNIKKDPSSNSVETTASNSPDIATENSTDNNTVTDENATDGTFTDCNRSDIIATVMNKEAAASAQGLNINAPNCSNL